MEECNRQWNQLLAGDTTFETRLNSLLDCKFDCKIELNSSVHNEMQSVATYSLLIPCSCAYPARKPAIHAAFRALEKKFPVIFPVSREFTGGRTLIS